MRHLLGNAVILGATVLSSQTLASTMPGAQCQPVGGAKGLINYDSNGRVHNPSSSSATIVCPIPRQNDTAGWSELTVVVADRHTTLNIVCDAFSSQVDGPGFSQQLSSVQFSPEWYQFEKLAFGPPTFVRDKGTFYVTCTLPPAQGGRTSAIDSYSITEACDGGWLQGWTDYSGNPAHDHRASVFASDCQ